MKRSAERILTTHVGSLARPDYLIPLLRLREQGQPYDREELARLVRNAVTDVVRKQSETGIDIVTDGEVSKPGFFTYVRERLDGFDASCFDGAYITGAVIPVDGGLGMGAVVAGSADAREGITAFVEKRAAKFQGR